MIGDDLLVVGLEKAQKVWLACAPFTSSQRRQYRKYIKNPSWITGLTGSPKLPARCQCFPPALQMAA